MGLLSKIGKKLKKWVTTAFKTITKPIRKALENKWVRRALMAVTFFTGAGAVMGAFASGGIKAGLTAVAKHLVNVGVKIIRTPFDIVAGGLKAAGSLMTGVGANSLGSFATNLGTGLSTKIDSVAGMANNIFAPKATSGAPTVNAAPDMAAPRPTSAPMASTSGAAATPPPGTASSGAAPSGAELATPPAAKPGMLKQAGNWIQAHPELTKIGVDAVAAMTTPDPYNASDEIRDRGNAWKGANTGQSADPFANGGNGGLLSALRQRNAELFAATQAKSRALMPGIPVSGVGG